MNNILWVAAGVYYYACLLYPKLWLPIILAFIIYGVYVVISETISKQPH